jgi:hypothetical protein
MPNYIFLLHEDPSGFQEMSAEEMQAIIKKYSAWSDKMGQSGALIRGEKLQDGTGRVLSKKGDKPSITDGPYTESKEIVGGFFEIQAENYQKAVEIALQCPHLEYGIIEVREIEPVR